MADAAFIHVQQSHAAFRAKLGLACVAGVEIENATNRFSKPLVRVPKDDGVRLMALQLRGENFGGRVGIDDVVNEKFFICERDDFGLFVLQPQIGVADADGDGRDEFKLQLDHRFPDIASVQDVIDAGKKFLHAGVEKTVGVGNDS